jgi:hypothetical protein
MDSQDIKRNTWQDVLKKKGFEPSTSEAFIGFISWNRGEEFAKLGREITEVLSGHEGKVFVKDAVSKKYNDKGLLFFNTDLPENIANEIFDSIMEYEQKVVYDTLSH